ncbi:MAG: hypothetical protein H6753_04845 [Candidatus Omnitrophica bacterium]|nr:hypothetical protein [Candidatus Omnitrophota bacterium]
MVYIESLDNAGYLQGRKIPFLRKNFSIFDMLLWIVPTKLKATVKKRPIWVWIIAIVYSLSAVIGLIILYRVFFRIGFEHVFKYRNLSPLNIGLLLTLYSFNLAGAWLLFFFRREAFYFFAINIVTLLALSLTNINFGLSCVPMGIVLVYIKALDKAGYLQGFRLSPLFKQLAVIILAWLKTTLLHFFNFCRLKISQFIKNLFFSVQQMSIVFWHKFKSNRRVLFFKNTLFYGIKIILFVYAIYFFVVAIVGYPNNLMKNSVREPGKYPTLLEYLNISDSDYVVKSDEVVLNDWVKERIPKDEVMDYISESFEAIKLDIKTYNIVSSKEMNIIFNKNSFAAIGRWKGQLILNDGRVFLLYRQLDMPFINVEIPSHNKSADSKYLTLAPWESYAAQEHSNERDRRRSIVYEFYGFFENFPEFIKPILFIPKDYKHVW